MATEQIIHPISAPPNAPKYYYPGLYYYTPEPYQTTHIPKHHDHHHIVPTPLKHAVHDFVYPLGENYQLAAPHCDIRETKSAYYLDVELPGLRDRGDVKLRWTGTRSLFVDAKIQRAKLPEEEEEEEEKAVPAEGVVVTTPPAEEGTSSSSPSSSSSSESDKKNKKEKKKGKKSKKSSKKENKKNVHFLKKERKTGELARAFNFPVDVEQDKTVAKLAYGVLSVVVPKKVKLEEAHHHEVEIEHAGH